MEPAEYQPYPPELHDYVDGRMSAEAERDFERRLERNPSLKRQADALRSALQLLHELPVVEPRPGFDERVIGRIRETDLADRARKQIAGAPVPLWKHAVQIGVGAAAAALVFAMIGMPGMFSDTDPDPTSGTGGEGVAFVSITEDDLLPALADHVARFESLRRNVAHIQVTDQNLQRELVSLELRHSDLMRRNIWLAGQVAELPPAQRAGYAAFIDSLDSALRNMEGEINGSFSERRPVNLASVNGALAAVRVPDGRVGGYRLNAPTATESDVTRIVAETTDDVVLFAELRKADYGHDHAGVIRAADLYLESFGQGRFKDHVNAMAIAAHLRMAEPELAAKRFTARFGDYDEDLLPGQLALVKGLMSDSEFAQLEQARIELRR